MKNALASTMSTLPELAAFLDLGRRQGAVRAHPVQVETGIPVFFADPNSPWQRGTNENTNGLLRQYLSKGTQLARWSAEDLAEVAATINNRPRDVLAWKSPAEVFNERLQSPRKAGVATIDWARSVHIDPLQRASA